MSMLSLASILAEGALRHPRRTALVAGSERISYAALWEEARRYAARLRALGIRPGDRVGILLLNSPDFPRAYYGVLALGAVVVPIHALLTPREIAYILADAGAKLLICGGPLLSNGAAGAGEAGVPLLEAGVPADAPIEALVPRREPTTRSFCIRAVLPGAPKAPCSHRATSC